MLIQTIIEVEIREAVWQCEGTKSPGPDGFNLGFIKKHWGILKQDVVHVINDFQSNGFIPKGCNASFIALIPKNDNPMGLHEYRPISLVGCMYKILAKILANRLKLVLPNIIHCTQSAFVKGRGLLDSVLVVNEVIKDARQNAKQCVIIKLDFEKAYDSVKWDFLFYMMARLGFCTRWINWIKACLDSSTISILVNGSLTQEFIPTKGLRQGDPLAPFLFLIVVEGLNGIVRQANKKQLLEGISVGTKQIKVNMLQFADNTLFFCKPGVKNIVAIKSILRCYEIASGLKVNFHKSELGGIGIAEDELKRSSIILNCGVIKVPFKYLEICVGGNPRKKQFWEPIVNKIKNKLSLWKGRFLSFAGRVCLIKSVLTAIPLYYMSFFKLPTCVSEHIMRIQRKFLWG